jgi:P4 family phage/plasmid primase-like protien
MERLSIRYKISPYTPVIHDDKLDQWNHLKELKGGAQQLPPANAGAGATTADAGNEWPNNNGANGSNMVGISPIMLPPELMNQSHNSEMISQLITCLNPEKRAGEYSDWVNLGLCLKNVGGDTEEMFGAWADITRRVNPSHKKAHYSTSKLQEKWKSFRANTLQSTNTIGIGSLHYWAKCDSPERYKEILEGDILTYIERYMDKTHTHFARLLHRLYGNIFVAAMDSKHTEWYKYEKNTWKHVYQASDIREKLIINVPEYLGKLRDRIRPKLADATNVKATNEQLKFILAMESSLCNYSFKNGVIKDAECYFRDCDFLTKLNANPYLMGFANGILNLRPERIDAHGIPVHDVRINAKDGSKEYYTEFREGRPEDYVSFQAGHSFEYQCEAYDYIKYNPDGNPTADTPADPDAKAIYAEIDDFMAKLFPDKKMREFMWRDLSSCLEGKNREQKYRTWIGVGGNGKSLLVSLMAITFGDYAMALPSQVLTRKRPDAGSANPDIMSIQNRRFIYTTEPDSGEPLNTSVMKQLSGEDSISARGLYQDQTKFQIAGKIYMLCNHYPQITSWDRGTWRRIWAFLFQSKFVNPDSEEAKDICPEKHVYPIDFALPNRIFVWRKYFMAKLVHIYTTEYLKYGLEPVPDLVKNESNNYRSQFDSFGKFKIECIREDKFSDKLVKIAVFYNAYRMWCESTGTSKKMGKTEFEKRMEGEFGKPTKSSYKRLKIINPDDDDEDE